MTGFTAVDRGPETDAIIAALTTAGIVTGDHTRPPGGGFPGGDSSKSFVPYAVVYQGITVSVDGPAGDPFADVEAEYQVTCVGDSRASASVIAKRVKTTLLTLKLIVPGRFVQLVSWERGDPATRDDDVTPVVFYTVDQYSVSTSPA